MSVNGKQASTQGLQKAMEAQTATGVDPYRKAQSYLKQMLPAISEALPKSKGMDAERLSRIVLTTLKMNPKLLDCTIESLLGAVLQSAQLGLEPNLLGSCYFIPYKNTVSFQIGYKGLIDLVTRKGEVTSIVAQEVRSGDYFHYEYGRNETLVHRPAPSKERGEITCFYAYAHLKNGGFTFQVMGLDEIEAVRDQFSVAYKYDKGASSMWVKHFSAMAQKTIIKKLIKYLPISVETQSAVAVDETIRKDITAESVYVPVDVMDNVQDFKVEILDKETNENVG
jgi:recombination protein RecT